MRKDQVMVGGKSKKVPLEIKRLLVLVLSETLKSVS